MSGYCGLQLFGPIADTDASYLSIHGWGRVRVPAGNYAAVMQMSALAYLKPLWIIRPEDAPNVPNGTDCELFNEPDAGCKGTPPWPRLTPQQYRAHIEAVWPILREKACKLWVGAVTNPSKPSLSWLTEVLRGLPSEIGATIHRYPKDATQSPMQPQKGHADIRAEDVAILDVMAGRPWGVSEAGFHTAPATTGRWWRKRSCQLTDQQVLSNHLYQADRFRRLGAQFYMVYQLSDGPDAGNPLDRYGIRRNDGAWKQTVGLPLLLR